MITDSELVNWFSYHPPGPVDQRKYEAIRNAALAFARVLVEHAPTSADQSAAIRHLRQAVMSANAAIACGGK